MQRRILTFLLFLAGLWFVPHSLAQEARAGCDSCLFRLGKLENPVDLSGKWLFTRQDSPQNKQVDLDTTHWGLISAPGPWFWVEPGKTFKVGWYRGVLEFAPEMVGKKAVVFMDTYLSRTEIYLDGELLFRRPDPDRFQPYYPIQAIPAVFTITKTRHVLSFRIQGYMMSGPYQLPLKIQKYDEAARSALNSSQIWSGGGQVRMLGAYLGLAFGLFFLLVFLKTRGKLNLTASLVGIGIFPFLGFPGDSFVNSWGPEVAYILHYPGLLVAYFIYLFIQCFTGWRRRLNKALGAACVGVTALFPLAAFVYRDATFILIARYLCIGLAFAIIFSACYDLFRAFWNNRADKDLRTLSIGLAICVATATSDGGIDFGLYSFYGTLSVGFMVLVGSILWVASIHFANTFQENKKLAKDLKVMNDNLEDLVVERTAQLRQKTNDIQAMLENMPQGVLTVLPGNRIHPEYSAYLEAIFETREISGKNLMQLVFSNTSLGSDILSQIETTIEACIGEDKLNFELNSHLLVTEFDKSMADGRVKSIELSWSPICIEQEVVEKIMLCARDVTEFKRLGQEASAQKRELEIIGEILAVSHEKFQEFVESAHKFGEENEAIIRRTNQKDPGVIGTLFRNMHTIKGNARTYGLLHMTNVVHETEQVYDELRKNPDMAWEPETLTQQLSQVRGLIDEYAKINSHTLGRKGPGRRGGVEKFLLVDKEQVAQSLQLVDSVDPTDLSAMRAALAQIGKTLSLIGTERIDRILSGVIESLPSLAKELGKEPPVIRIEDHGIVVRNQISGLLKNLFVHLLRNSMDHGLETAAERQNIGKTPVGNIRLSMAIEDDRLAIRLRDDGRGLNIARIRQIAIGKSMLPAGDTTAPETVAQLIFAPGFSTAEKVTEVSGRGVGMDAVKGFLENEGGNIAILFLDENSAADFRPIEILITLPGKFAVQG